MLNPFARLNSDRSILLPVWSAADGVGAQSAVLAPWIIGAYVAGYSLSIYQAGLLLTLEFSALALTNFLTAPWIAVLNRRRLALAGVSIVIAMNLLCYFLEGWHALVAARMMCGLGYGLAMAAGNAAAAAANDSARLYGHKIAMLALFAAVMFVTIPSLVERFGTHFLFIGMAGFNLLLLWPITRMPAYARGAVSPAAQCVPSGAANSTLLLAMLIVAAVLCFSTRDTMVAILFERLGEQAGLSAQRIGAVLAVSGLVGILGPLGSIALVHRFGPYLPSLLVVALGALVDHGAAYFGSALLFSSMVVIQPVLNLGAYALHMSIAARLDAHGRLTTACGGAALGSYALAPVLGGYAMEHGGTGALHWTLLGMSLGYLVLFVALRTLGADRTRAVAATQPA